MKIRKENNNYSFSKKLKDTLFLKDLQEKKILSTTTYKLSISVLKKHNFIFN